MKDTEIKRRKGPDATAKETSKLFEDYAHSRDPSLRDKLILGHQNLVHYLASKFANRGIPLEDLAQVGMIGLVHAVDRFEPDRGLQFSTFATPTIVGEIRRHFRDKGWSMKVPRRLQELNLAAAKASGEVSAKLGHPASIHEIAMRIGATEEETLQAIEMGNAYDTVSIDSQMQAQGESTPLTLADFLGEEDESIQRIEIYGDLRQAMDSLEPREKAIIYYRFFKDLSQTQVAERLDISQMHVSRLQQKAIKKLKDLMKDQR